jgi:hypothetical protein
VAAARIIEVIAGRRRAPVLEYASETTRSNVGFDHALRHECQTESGQRGVDHLRSAVENELTLDAYENKVDDLHAGLGRMGRTSYHVAVEEVLAQHRKAAPGIPALVVFQTDGAPDAKTPATQSLTEAAKNHPAVFFSFVAFGDPENKAFDYLRKLKLPNTSHFLAGETPKELTDAEIYEGILANWRP